MEDANRDLPALILAECQDLMAQIVGKRTRIEVKSKRMKALATETDTARRLPTMPGVGPWTTLAVEAFAPDMAQLTWRSSSAAAALLLGWDVCHGSILSAAKSDFGAYQKQVKTTSGAC